MGKALHKLREQLSEANIFVSTSVQGPVWTGRKGLLLFMVRSGSLLSNGGLAIWLRAVHSVPLLLGRENKRNSLRVLDVYPGRGQSLQEWVCCSQSGLPLSRQDPSWLPCRPGSDMKTVQKPASTGASCCSAPTSHGLHMSHS